MGEIWEKWKALLHFALEGKFSNNSSILELPVCAPGVCTGSAFAFLSHHFPKHSETPTNAAPDEHFPTDEWIILLYFGLHTAFCSSVDNHTFRCWRSSDVQTPLKSLGGGQLSFVSRSLVQGGLPSELWWHPQIVEVYKLCVTLLSNVARSPLVSEFCKSIQNRCDKAVDWTILCCWIHQSFLHCP